MTEEVLKRSTFQTLDKAWLILTSSMLVLGVLWIWASKTDPASTTGGHIPAPHKGFAAPDFSLAGSGGTEIILSHFRGQPVIINFWATWCPPCRAEMPALQEVYDGYQDQGLVILGVNATYSESAEKAVDFMNEMGLDFPVAFDQDGSVASQYQVRSLPTTFFVDANGIIQEVVIGGPLSEAMLRIRVEELIQQGAE